MLSLDDWDIYRKGGNSDFALANPSNLQPIFTQKQLSCHLCMELCLQLQLSTMLSSWTFSSFITTSAHPLPLIPFPRHIYPPLLPPTGHSMTVVYSDIMIGFTSQMQTTSDSESSSTNMITSSPGMLDKTRPLW
jgi:hypothetical protein